MSKARQLADLGNVYDDGALSNRNLIINGAMQVAQRGTSVTGATSAGYSTVDRMNHNSSGATLDMSRQDFALGQTDVPSQFKHYFRMNATTGANNAGLRYRVEDVQSVPEGSVTLSFYAKGTNPNGGNFELDLSQSFGSGGSTSVTLPFETLTVTSSWQRFTYTLAVPSISGKTVGSGNYFQIYWKQPNGDNSTNAWTLDITGVQLEVGDSASPFEHRSYGDELARCQRYCLVYNPVYYQRFPVFGNGTAAFLWYPEFPVEMRASPSLIQKSLSSSTIQVYNYTADGVRSFSSAALAEGGILGSQVNIAVSSGSGVGHVGSWRWVGTPDAYIGFDAEL